MVRNPQAVAIASECSEDAIFVHILGFINCVDPRMHSLRRAKR